MDDKDERWAVFWCGLLHPILFEEIDASQTNRYLKELAQKEVIFPNGREGKASLSTLRRKLNRYGKGGFSALARKPRTDRNKPRAVPAEVMAYAVELKREQPRRSEEVINRFLQDRFGLTVPRSTLYRHLREAGATRLKLGMVKKKVRKRWTRDHTHDLWVGDFEEGPYVQQGDEALPTHLSGFIDAHSRYAVEARYYLRQSLDILIDSLLRALATHGAPRELYLDNAKVYHAHGLKAACGRLHVNLLHRPPYDPAPGGLIERFFQTAQSQFEAEVRAGAILSLDKLNRALSAWLEMAYHQRVHSETKQTPKERYGQGLTVIRQVDMAEVLASFMRREERTVHRDFADVQLRNRFYRVDSKLRGDKIEVRYDPFGALEVVHLYSLKGHYLGEGMLHHRQSSGTVPPRSESGKPKNSYLDLLFRQHEEQLAAQTRGIDYRKVSQQRAWPFADFIKTFAHLSGRKGGFAAFTAHELESLKKLYNQHATLDKERLKRAFATAQHKTITYIAYELRQQDNQKEDL
jgi:transposase InsO family protein